MKVTILVLLLSISYSLNQTLVGTCHASCGANDSSGCTDFNLNSVSADNCKSCAPGYIGGAPEGATCTAGTCDVACVACANLTPDACYLCSPGYYDPVSDRFRATPCLKCHASCKTCGNTTENGCFICADGYFDAQNNPYSMSSCQKCDASCATCSGSATNCVGGCANNKNYSNESANRGSCS